MEGSGRKQRKGGGEGAGCDNFKGEYGLEGIRGYEGRRRGLAGRRVEGGEEAKGVSNEVPTHACTHVARRAGRLIAVCGVYLWCKLDITGRE